MISEKNLKVVLVGCGSISERWMQAVQQIAGVEMIGFVDILEAAAQKRADEYGVHNAVIGTDPIQVLQKTAPDIVFNCTIPEAHSDITLKALKYGCHVLSEKPMSSTIAEARAMILAAQEARRTFAVVQNYRYNPAIRRLRHFLTSGRFGPLTTVNSDFSISVHFGGFRDHMRHVLLLDMAIHTFDAARFITGTDPVSVYCKEWNPSGSWYDHDASAVAIFEMTKGLVYMYRGSWCAEGFNTTWNADWRIICEKGSATWDGGKDFRTQGIAAPEEFPFLDQDGANSPDDVLWNREGHAGVIREFIDCIRQGTIPETNCTDNIKSLAMVLGAIESAEQGKRVEIKW